MALVAMMVEGPVRLDNASFAGEPLYGEDGTLRESGRLANLGRYGESEKLLRECKSPEAKAIRAIKISKDDPSSRERGQTFFDPALAKSLALEAIPHLRKTAPTDTKSANSPGGAVLLRGGPSF
jgi:hypothetical protein